MSVDEQALLADLVPELEAADPVTLQLPPAEAFAIVGVLQLALRHPNVPAGPAAVARDLVDQIAVQSGPAVRRAIEAGWRAGPARLQDRPGLGQPLVPTHVTDVAIARAEATVERARGFLERLDVVVDERIPPDTFIVLSGDPAHPERGGDAVVVDLAAAAVPAERPPLEEGRRPVGIVRPAGLVWAGIRVDEMERLYEVLDQTHESCPAQLQDGEIYGEPTSGRVWVWSLADFRRLADLSRFLHALRRRGIGAPMSADEGRLAAAYEAASRAANTGADAIDVVRALPAGTS